MENIIIIGVLLAIASGIVWYLVRAKKRGEKCASCPYAKKCCKKTDCCGNNEKEKN